MPDAGDSSFAPRATAPKDAARQANPVAFTAESQTRGKVYYNNYCLACHGKDARGDGVTGTSLKPPPPDLWKSKKSHTDGDFFWKIQNGRGDMPSFKEDLSDEQVWDIINFIKHGPE